MGAMQSGRSRKASAYSLLQYAPADGALFHRTTKAFGPHTKSVRPLLCVWLIGREEQNGVEQTPLNLRKGTVEFVRSAQRVGAP